MLRSNYGFWLADAGPVEAQAPLTDDIVAEVAVVGGGFLGMWTAWHLVQRGADVTIVDADVCGHGPSGRNGGFIESLWDRMEEMRSLFGAEGAIRVARASSRSVYAIRDWCDREGIDAQVIIAPMLEVAIGPGEENSWATAVKACHELGFAEEAVSLARTDVRAVCNSSTFLAGASWTTHGTLHPAKLALGLRERLLQRGVRIYERTRVSAFQDEIHGVTLTTDTGQRIRARSAVLAINSATGTFAPFRRALSVASSHIVVTEPVPAILERLNWTGGESIVDCRSMLHYFRTTQDGRVVFGWAGGRMGAGARSRAVLEFDPKLQDRTAEQLFEVLPELDGATVEQAWGGPIDVSPVHLPWYGTLKSTHYGFGFTGNGVGPAEFGGEILADLIEGARTELSTLPIVGGLPPKRFPPEPFRFVGGSLIRAAQLRNDDAQASGGRVDPVTAALASLPQRLGLHLPR